jgi:hypothetical protein
MFCVGAEEIVTAASAGRAAAEMKMRPAANPDVEPAEDLTAEGL